MVMKFTYHPNWRVTIDGNETPTFMASPSYLAFAIPAGEHFVVAEYRSTPIKAPLLLFGGIVLAGTLAWGPLQLQVSRRRHLQAQWSGQRARPD
jgi:hypothetical protein